MTTKTIENRKIGEFIAEVRELKGFTQSGFAKALKTSYFGLKFMPILFASRHVATM